MGSILSSFSKLKECFTSKFRLVWGLYSHYSDDLKFLALILRYMVPGLATPITIFFIFKNIVDVGAALYKIYIEYNNSTSWREFANATTLNSFWSLALTATEKKIPFLKPPRVKVLAALQFSKTAINVTIFGLKLCKTYIKRDSFSIWDGRFIIYGVCDVCSDVKDSKKVLSNIYNVQRNTGITVNYQTTAAETKNEQKINTAEKLNGITNKSKQAKENMQGNRETLQSTPVLEFMETTQYRNQYKIESSEMTQHKIESPSPIQNMKLDANPSETSGSHTTDNKIIKYYPIKYYDFFKEWKKVSQLMRFQNNALQQYKKMTTSNYHAKREGVFDTINEKSKLQHAIEDPNMSSSKRKMNAFMILKKEEKNDKLFQQDFVLTEADMLPVFEKNDSGLKEEKNKSF